MTAVDAQPHVDLPVRLRLPEPPDLTARLDARRGDDLFLRLAVAAPAPPVGTPSHLLWSTPRGLHELPAEFGGIDPANQRRWRLRALAAARLVQRRDYVRVPVGLPAALGLPDVGTVAAEVVDISEGGCRCIVVDCPAPPAGTPVTVAFRVLDRALELSGTVCRVAPVDHRRVAIALDLPASSRDADLLRRYALQLQREARARSLRP